MGRDLSFTDRIVLSIDGGVRALFGARRAGIERNPANGIDEVVLSDHDRRRSGRLMRVNHAGEIAAQALYHGQALTAHRRDIRASMERAAAEENAHLVWCEQRLHELDAHPSYLKPFWYFGSLAIGMMAGATGDKLSLGFVAETEHQVVDHLNRHLSKLPEDDSRSRAILERMREDEARHATAALGAGGAHLPLAARKMMALTAKFMTRTAYWI